MQQNLLSLDDVKSYFEHWQATRTKLQDMNNRAKMLEYYMNMLANHGQKPLSY